MGEAIAYRLEHGGRLQLHEFATSVPRDGTLFLLMAARLWAVEVTGSWELDCRWRGMFIEWRRSE